MRRGTYSIVARDPQTGQLGVAVQSHWFGVGMVVPWAEPGVGAVATQSIAERSYGPRACELLREGHDPDQALQQLTEADSAAAARQVAVVDAHGNVATHTGSLCIREAGHVTGDGFSCQANMMLNATVPQAMADAFTAADPAKPLDERLLAALDAAEAEGGDIRGRQSATLLVVGGSGDEHWQRDLDLRVDDHPDPLDELRRLHRLHRAYATSERAEELLADGRYDEATRLFVEAAELAPDNDELLFWAGLNTESLDKVRAAAEINPRWLELLDRLSPEIAPTAAAVRQALGR